DAFGAGPVRVEDLPEYMLRFGDVNAEGTRMVTSHRFEDGDAGKGDAHVGTLTSAPFTVERRYLQALVGGGAHDATCLQVRVGEEVVAEFTGTNVEPMSWVSADLSRWEGERATVRIVDDVAGDWGHVNVDTIKLSDEPVDPSPADELPDHGTFALAALDDRAEVRPSVAAWSSPEELFTADDGPDDVDGGTRTLAGTVRVPVHLAPGASARVRFAVGWYFPVPDRESLSF